MKIIFFCVTLDLSDNLTEMRQISLSRKTPLPKFINYLIDKGFCLRDDDEGKQQEKYANLHLVRLEVLCNVQTLTSYFKGNVKRQI